MDLNKERSIHLKMLTCFLCEKTGLIVKKFNEERLEKCRKIQAFRKKKNLIYKDVVLPKSLMQRGYHLQCYDKFIILKSNNRKEFASMFGNGKVLINNIPPLKIDSPNAFKKNTASSSVEIPKLIEIEIPHIGTKTCVTDLKVTPFNTYQMNEPSYVNPDISRGVILKSILTRKSPIKKDMTKDHFAFNSGMDLFRYGSIFNQPNLNYGEETLGPKIVEMDSSANEVCLFCGKEQRKIGMQFELPEIVKEDEIKKVLELAKAMEDEDLLEKLKENTTFSCHPLCRVEYRNKHQKITTKNCTEEDRLVIKELKTKVFEALCAFIDDQIIDKNKTYFLADLFERYKALLCEIQNSNTPLDVESSILTLQDEILIQYEGIIKITTKSKKKIVYKDGTADFDSALIENEAFKQDKIAFELRTEIKSMKRNSDGENDEEIPEKLLRFIGCLIQGPAARSSYENSVKIKSLCENIEARVNMED